MAEMMRLLFYDFESVHSMDQCATSCTPQVLSAKKESDIIGLTQSGSELSPCSLSAEVIWTRYLTVKRRCRFFLFLSLPYVSLFSPQISLNITLVFCMQRNRTSLDPAKRSAVASKQPPVKELEKDMSEEGDMKPKTAMKPTAPQKVEGKVAPETAKPKYQPFTGQLIVRL